MKIKHRYYLTFTSSKDERLIKVLNLYVSIMKESLSLETLVKSDEIVYWLDRHNTSYNINIVGLYNANDELIGFIQYADIEYGMNNVIFVDYIYCSNNEAFKIAEDMLNNFNNLGYIIITEIMNDNKALLRLVRMKGFSFTTDYIHPMTGTEVSEIHPVDMIPSDVNATLCSNVKVNFKDITKLIYFKHYLKWYEPFMANKDYKSYELYLNKVMLNRYKIMSRKDAIQHANGEITKSMSYKQFVNYIYDYIDAICNEGNKDEQ